MSKGKNQQIEGLRGITILIIILYHVYCRFYQIYYKQDVLLLHYWGSFGVTIFFLISSYFLGTSTNENFSLRNYVQRKLIRLIPSYLISIILIFCFTHVFYLPERTVGIKDFLLNFFFLSGYIGTPYVDGAHWYLFLLVPIILTCGILKKLRWNDVIWFYYGWIVCDYILLRTGHVFFARLLGGTYLGVVMVGISIFKLFAEKQQHGISWICLFFVGFIFTHRILGTEGVIELILSVGIISLALTNKLSIVDKRFFTFVGDLSYYLYLIHQNISFAIAYNLSQINDKYNIVYGIIAILFAFVLAKIIKGLDQRISGLLKRSEK